MPNYLLTYDLKEQTPAKHQHFKDEARRLGWDWWARTDTGWVKLPNTTIVSGELADDQAARDAVIAISSGANAAIASSVICRLDKAILSSAAPALPQRPLETMAEKLDQAD